MCAAIYAQLLTILQTCSSYFEQMDIEQNGSGNLRFMGQPFVVISTSDGFLLVNGRSYVVKT